MADTPTDWTPLVSSNLSACKYDAQTATLTVRFNGGREYTYYNVPPTVIEELSSANSPGEYFNSAVKDAFKHRRVR